MFTLFYVIFSRANVFALFFDTFTSEYVYAVLCFFFFSSECVCAVYGTFHELMCFRCVYAVYGTFTSEYVFAVYVIFLERMCLRCLWYFHERICLFMLFFLKRMCLRWVICSFLLANMFSLFMAPYNMSTLLWYFFISERICLCCYVELLPANMF